MFGQAFDRRHPYFRKCACGCVEDSVQCPRAALDAYISRFPHTSGRRSGPRGKKGG
jgi:hypothetical protein